MGHLQVKLVQTMRIAIRFPGKSISSQHISKSHKQDIIQGNFLNLVMVYQMAVDGVLEKAKNRFMGLNYI